MGRLGGFRYREVTKRLKKLGFEFDRQAAGSHEIWYNPATKAYTTIPNRKNRTPTLFTPVYPSTSSGTRTFLEPPPPRR
jgi:predicted RNA binding protein YcfA (HicA-like mRNA interferase family)